MGHFCFGVRGPHRQTFLLLCVQFFLDSSSSYTPRVTSAGDDKYLHLKEIKSCKVCWFGGLWIAPGLVMCWGCNGIPTHLHRPYQTLGSCVINEAAERKVTQAEGMSLARQNGGEALN